MHKAPLRQKSHPRAGGSAPFLVFSDSDLSFAVDGLIAAKFRNSGQACTCADRVFVQADIYDRFAEALIHKVKSIQVGDGFDPATKIGPLINEAAVEKIERHVNDATAKGASLKLGGHRHALGRTFFEPTVLCDVDPSMLIMQEESFGPVAPLMRFETEEEAIQLANDTSYGLAAYLYTKDSDRIWRISKKLDFGMVGVNVGLLSNEVAPFGGIKESGMAERAPSMASTNTYEDEVHLPDAFLLNYT